MMRTTAFAFLVMALPVLAEDSKPKPDVEARALVDQAKGKHGKAALELYNQAIALDANCIDAYIGRGGERRYDEPALALADFARADAIKDDFQPLASWYRIVTLLDVYLDRSAAWDEAERLRRKSSKGAWAFLGTGIQKLLAGKYDMAEEDFDHVGKADADVPYAWRFKALAEFEYGNTLAKDAVQLAVKQEPDDAGTQATAALVQGADDPAMAARELDRIFGEKPKFAWAMLAKAKSFAKASKWDETLAATAAAETASPAGAETAYFRGIALLNQSKYDEAETALARAVNWDANFPDALLKRGDARSKRHDWSGAIRDYEAWVLKFGNDEHEKLPVTAKINEAKSKRDREEGVIVSFDGFLNRARVWIEEDDFDRAMKDIETAKGLDEKNERWRRVTMFYWAKKKEWGKFWEAAQALIDAGGEAAVTIKDPRADGGTLYKTLAKDPAFLDGLKGLVCKVARDAYWKAQIFYDAVMPDVYKADQAKAGPMLRESAAEFQKLVETWKDAPETNGAYYNEACCWALVNEADKAFDALGKAIDNGYGKDPGEINHMEKEDTDFDNIHKDPRWEAIVKKAKEKWGEKK
jgi:tetratricopeptide (TPR) repeat protein